MAGGRFAGRGLMMAGAIVMFIGLGVVLVRTVGIAGYWMPFFVGLGLFIAGVIAWMTSNDRSR
jgi:hypothetical protein